MYSIGIATVLLLFVSIDAHNVPSDVPTAVKLNDGWFIPIVGLGTFESTSGDAERAVKSAIDAGYRHIDTAFLYGNEVEVGNAVRAKIKEGVIERTGVYITTKLWSTFHEKDQVEKAFQRSADNLDLGYIDLFLMHYPGKTLTTDVDYLETWRAMENLVDDGLEQVHSIGLSNFNSEQIERILSIARIKPVVNQIECHPNLNQRKLIEFCAARNITVTCYSPLGRPHTQSGRKLAISDPKVLELAQKYKKTPAQILLRYSVQNGAIVIPKSTNPKRIEENINIFDFELSDVDMQIMHGLNDNSRLIAFESDKDNKNYPFNIEF